MISEGFSSLSDPVVSQHFHTRGFLPCPLPLGQLRYQQKHRNLAAHLRGKQEPAVLNSCEKFPWERGEHPPPLPEVSGVLSTPRRWTRAEGPSDRARGSPRPPCQGRKRCPGSVPRPGCASAVQELRAPSQQESQRAPGQDGAGFAAWMGLLGVPPRRAEAEEQPAGSSRPFLLQQSALRARPRRVGCERSSPEGLQRSPRQCGVPNEAP